MQDNVSVSVLLPTDLSELQTQPIFIGGASRSGTTIVTTALAKHSQVFGRNEMGWTDYFLSFMSKINHSDSPKWARMAISHNELYDRLARLMFDCSTEQYVKNGLFQQHHFTRWSGKVPTLLSDIEHLTTLFPKASFILVVRNGIEVLNSVLSWNRPDYGFEQGCIEWCRHAQAAMDAKSKENVMVVRHDALVKDSRLFWQEIMSFLQMPFEECLVEHCATISNSSFSQQGTVASSATFNRKNILDHWSDSQKAYFNTHCKPWMRALGYEF